MLMFRIASAWATGQGSRSTSSSRAARCCRRRRRRSRRGCSPGAPGTHPTVASAGRAAAGAKKATCWPVPLAISRTRPVAGSTRRSTSRIGSRLRSVAAAWRPPLGTGCGSKKAMTMGAGRRPSIMPPPPPIANDTSRPRRVCYLRYAASGPLFFRSSPARSVAIFTAPASMKWVVPPSKMLVAR